MADKKPFDFDVLGTVEDTTELYTQPGGTEDRKFFLTTLWEYLRKKLSGGSPVLSDGATLNVNADELVVAITFTSTVDQTIKVGTSAGGDNVLKDLELTAAQIHTEVIHYQFTAAGALHFSFPGGDVTVRTKKF